MKLYVLKHTRRQCVSIWSSAVLLWLLTSLSGQLVSQVVSSGENAHIEGRVLDSNGRTIDGASVQLRGKDTGSSRLAKTNADGIYRFADLLPGTYELEASAKDFSPKKASVELVAEQLKTLDLDLTIEGIRTEVVVTTDEEAVPTATSTATRTATALLDLPQSVQIIPQKLLEDQQALTMADVVKNVSGITVPNSSGSRAEDLNFRGFTTGAVFKDGFRNDGFANRTSLEIANIERVEVVKGPSSSMFGRLDPSGMVNFITKQPLPKHHLSLELQHGSWHMWRPTMDLSGPVNKSGTLLYRFNFAYLNSDSFRDFLYHRRIFVSPALTWNIRPSTALRFYSEYLGGENVIDRGIVAIGDRPAPLPVSRFLGNPFVPYPYKQGKIGLTFEHFFGSNWSFRSSERSSVNFAAYNGWQPTGLLANIAGNTLLSVSEGHSDQNLRIHQWTNDFTGRVTTGPIEHTVLIGFDLNSQAFNTETYASVRRQVQINIFRPDYSVFPPPISLGLSGANLGLNRYGGLYLQDQMKLTKRLKLLVGGRYDLAQIASTNYFTNVRTNYRNTAFVPRVGILYNTSDSTSLYFTYGKSFLPQGGLTVSGSTFEPERGDSYEGGFKAELLGRKVTATAAVFQVRRSGILTADPLNEGFSIQVGEQRNRGVEFDLLGRPTRNWSFVLNYAHNDPVITRDNVYKPGNFVLSTPFNTGTLWTTYEFSRGVARGFSFGGGIAAVGKRWADLENTAIIPGYVRTDLSVAYRIYRADRVRYRVSLNVNNLLDRYYMEGVRGLAGIVPGAPRNFLVGIQFIR